MEQLYGITDRGMLRHIGTSLGNHIFNLVRNIRSVVIGILKVILSLFRVCA